MSNTLFPLTRQQFFANNGTPLAGGLVYTYAAGTSTPQASYTASGATNTNPVVLDFRGSADLWGAPNSSYKVNLTDSAGNQIPGYPIDGVQVGPTTSGTFTAIGTGFAGTAPTFACNYTIIGNVVVLRIAGALGVSNATTFTLTSIPAVILPPTSSQVVPLAYAEDNTTTVYNGLLITVSIGNIWPLWLAGDTAGWTASGVKGLPEPVSFSYLLI